MNPRTLLSSSLLALATVSSFACGGDPNEVRQFSQLRTGFQYIAFSGGFDADDNLVLVGQELWEPNKPFETIRWNRKKKDFERFGGPVPGSGGQLLRDGSGRLYLATVLGLHTLESSGATWSALNLPPGRDQNSAVQRVYSLTEMEVDRAGNLYGVFEYFGPTPPGTGPLETGYALLKRATGTSDWVPLFEARRDSKGLIQVGDKRTYPRETSVRGDGTVFLSTDDGLFVMPTGTSTFVPAFDCASVVGKYCTPALPVFTNPRSDEAFLAGYRLPKGNSFPMVPQEVEVLGPTAKYRVAADGSIWSYVDVKGARTVDYPPYVLDVTTVRKLDGSKWNVELTFDTPSFTLVHSDHDAFYSFGNQLIAGGNYTSWGVYGLEY